MFIFRSISFRYLLFGPCEENILMKQNRSRDVFKVSTSTKTFQSRGSFSVHPDPLECCLLFSAVKPFPIPSFSLWISSLLSSPFFLWEPSLLLLLQLLHSGWHLLLVLSGRLEDYDLWGNWCKFFWVNRFVPHDHTLWLLSSSEIDRYQLCG